MFDHFYWAPQIAGLLILLQRGIEELHSQRNTKRLLQLGAHEEGREYYPVVATTHLGWIASLAFVIPPGSPVYYLPLAAFLVLQPVRYWIICTLGQYWTHRIITVPDEPVIAHGPYRYMRHPNYAVTVAETLLMPLVFGQLALAVIFTAVWAVVLRYKIRLENEALAVRQLKEIGEL